MVETQYMTNGTAALPEILRVTTADLKLAAAASPGTMREFKAQTGLSFRSVFDGDAEWEDRNQTIAWVILRRDRPGLAWADCEDVGLMIDDEAEATAVDPTSSSSGAASPRSATSGG